MENRKVLTKRKLIFAFLAALLIVAVVTFLSQQIAFTAYASSLDEFDIQEEILFDGNSEPLVDIEFEDGTLGWDPIVYAAQQAQHQVAAQIAQVSFQTYAAPSGIYGELRTMHAATKTKNQIIIYIIADRYTDSQQTTFFTDAQNIANHLINSFPISEYKEWVQIYAIGTISTSSSISIIAGGAGTASGDITRDNVCPFVQYHFPSVTNPSIANNHSWLVMQNGRGGGYAYPEGYSEAGVAVTSTAVGTALHEQGHLWGLWDEYDTSTYYSVYNDGPNTRRNVNLSNPKTGTNAIPSQWGLFIGETAGTNNRWEGIDNVGLYPMSTAGWGSTIWYRPNSQCTMNVSSGNPYCQVCAEHIFRRFSSGRELYTVIVSGSNTTITGLTATGKSVSNDLTIPVVHSDGIVKTIGNGSSSGFSGSSTTNFFLRMEVKYLLLQRAHFLMQLKCPKLQSLQVSQILLQMPLKTVLV